MGYGKDSGDGSGTGFHPQGIQRRGPPEAQGREPGDLETSRRKWDKGVKEEGSTSEQKRALGAGTFHLHRDSQNISKQTGLRTLRQQE